MCAWLWTCLVEEQNGKVSTSLAHSEARSNPSDNRQAVELRFKLWKRDSCNGVLIRRRCVELTNGTTVHFSCLLPAFIFHPTAAEPHTQKLTCNAVTAGHVKWNAQHWNLKEFTPFETGVRSQPGVLPTFQKVLWDLPNKLLHQDRSAWPPTQAVSYSQNATESLTLWSQ